MKKSSKRLLFAAGGTGGHLFPAQALAQQLQSLYPGCDILFAGAHLESNAYFDRSQFAYRNIVSATPFSGNCYRALLSMKSLLKGFRQSLALFKEKKPDLVIGFGSFHTFPLLCAAVLKKTPFILFESNAIPGKVVRLFSKKAQCIGIYFSSARQYLKGECQEVEIPKYSQQMHSKQEARRYFQLDPEKPTLLVFGGSQGAKAINQLLLQTLPFVKAPFQLLHFTGCDQTARQVTVLCQELQIPCVAKKFESKMSYAYSASDLCLSRAGAITLSELIHYTLPAILIPYPAASDQHQLKNAQIMAEKGSALYFQEHLVNPQQLANTLCELLSAPSCMQNAMRQLKSAEQKGDFATLIAQFLQE